MDQTTSVRRTALYPPLEPSDSGMLDLDGGHRMYYEVSGNPEGVPVVFLHGGPGAGTHAHHRRYFDPRHYRIVLFDQRGAGRSEPFGELAGNTTPDLIADMERLRRHLAVERWMLFGGSWGSTLALAYAEEHPDRCLGLVLRGIFLGRKLEVDWFLHGMRNFFPEAWDRFVGFLPPEERSHLLTNYYRRLTDPARDVHMPAARVWAAYEGACSTLRHDPAIEASSAPSAWRWAWRGSRPITSSTTCSWPTTSCSTGSACCRVFPRWWSRGAMTWCARSAAPTSWSVTGPGSPAPTASNTG